MCTGSEGNIYIERIEAVTLFVEPLAEVVRAYKYEKKTGWAQIFARLLLGHLETHWNRGDADLIVANPSGPDRDHTTRVLESAQIQDLLNRWPFDDAANPSVEKTETTQRSAAGNLAAKRQAAKEHADALELTRPELIEDANVVIYDDILTTGLQLNEVARRLREWGAESVTGIVLARQPWS